MTTITISKQDFYVKVLFVDYDQNNYDYEDVQNHDQQILEEVKKHNEKIQYSHEYIDNEKSHGSRVDLENTSAANAELQKTKQGYLRIILVSNWTNNAYQSELKKQQEQDSALDKENSKSKQKLKPIDLEDDPYHVSVDDTTLQDYYDQMQIYKIPEWDEDFDIEHQYEPKNLEEYVPYDPEVTEVYEMRAFPVYTQELIYTFSGIFIYKWPV